MFIGKGLLSAGARKAALIGGFPVHKAPTSAQAQENLCYWGRSHIQALKLGTVCSPLPSFSVTEQTTECKEPLVKIDLNQTKILTTQPLKQCVSLLPRQIAQHPSERPLRLAPSAATPHPSPARACAPTPAHPAAPDTPDACGPAAPPAQ